jgi:VCBS repeat-containing protein
VHVFDGQTDLGSANVDNQGQWSAQVMLSSAKTHVLTATDMDAAGNVGVSNAVTYTRTNAAPVAKPGTASGDEDHLITGQLSATDANGDLLTYTLVKPVNGLTLTPDGSFTYDPTLAFDSLRQGQTGTLAFQFKASDGLLTSNTATETIKIAGVNDIALLGQYIAGSFAMSAGGFGGTPSYDPTPANLAQTLTQPQHA